MHQEEEEPTTLESKLRDMNDEVDKGPVRTRPTNNQLLYKAYFRWGHYPVAGSAVHENEETDACASVTAAFWQVMCTLQKVEAIHCRAENTNVLKRLSQDTRHTKIVNLACGTHKVSEELKKHSLTDDEGTQYTTNLDRNRYGPDNQYMVTVIRYNLASLGLCPCLVDVEVLDQKSNETRMISAGIQLCTCVDEADQIWDQKNEQKKEKQHYFDGQNCSPGSSTHAEDKTSWRSSTSSGARGRTADSNRNHRSLSGGHVETKIQTFSKHPSSALLQSFDCVATRRQRRNKWKKSPPEIHEHLPFSMNFYKSENPTSGVVNKDYFKRTRETDGMLWETSNHDVTFGGGGGVGGFNSKLKERKNQNNSNFDTKRFKSSFQQLELHPEGIFEDLKTKFGHSMNTSKIEEDLNRIERLEKEISFLRKQLESVGDPNEVEARVNTHRRSTGQLLEVLHQTMQAKGHHHGLHQPHLEDPRNSENELEQILNCFNSVNPSFEEGLSCRLDKEERKRRGFDNASAVVTQWISNPSNQALLLSDFSTSPTNKPKPQTMIKTDPTSDEKLNLGVEYAQSPRLGVQVHSFDLGYDSMLNLERRGPQSLLPSVAWNSPESRLSIGRKLGNL